MDPERVDHKGAVQNPPGRHSVLAADHLVSQQALPSCCRGLLPLLRQGRQLSGYEGEESPVEERGFEADKCSRSKRASLDSIAASRAFSFFSCSVSLLSCNICCS